MRTHLVLLIAGLLSATPAKAQSLADLLASSSPADLARAVDTICLKPVDQPAQVAAAQDAPYEMTRSGRSAEGDVYTKWPLQVTIASRRGVDMCVVTANMEEATTLADVAAAATPIIGRGAPTINEPRGTIAWPAGEGELFVTFQLFRGTGTKTGTFGTGRRKST